jgi:hypothetical protein
MREDRHHNLGVVLVARREKRRIGRSIRRENKRLLLARAPLALEVAARDAAGRVGALLVVHGEREEVEAGFGCFSDTTVASTVVSP